LDDSRYFRKYQWITADVRRAEKDNRPESYRINPLRMEPGEAVKTKKGGNWEDRASYLLRPHNVVQSVEELQSRERADHTSLGILKPKSIVQVDSEPFPKIEKQRFVERYDSITSQMLLDLDGEKQKAVKPLQPPDFRFRIRFSCDDSACRFIHRFGILDWEVDALYFNLKTKHRSAEKARSLVVAHLRAICDDQHETRFFLGNISTHPTNFTIVGLWYPKIQPQHPLLEFDAP
jgi:hypothetical protein